MEGGSCVRAAANNRRGKEGHMGGEIADGTGGKQQGREISSESVGVTKNRAARARAQGGARAPRLPRARAARKACGAGSCGAQSHGRVGPASQHDHRQPRRAHAAARARRAAARRAADRVAGRVALAVDRRLGVLQPDRPAVVRGKHVVLQRRVRRGGRLDRVELDEGVDAARGRVEADALEGLRVRGGGADEWRGMRGL